MSLNILSMINTFKYRSRVIYNSEKSKTKSFPSSWCSEHVILYETKTHQNTFWHKSIVKQCIFKSKVWFSVDITKITCTLALSFFQLSEINFKWLQ